MCTAFGTTVLKPAHDLGADRNAEQRRSAVRSVAFAGRQHRRDDHRAGMHRPALESVVEILAMRRGAVDEGGACRAQACARGRSAVQGPSSSQPASARFDIVLVARGDAEPDDVDQQILAFRAHRRRQLVRATRSDALGKMLRQPTVLGSFAS